jgi:DNA topoisomerase-6 subunit B
VINGVDRAKLYEQLLAVAKKKTSEADVKLDDRGRPIEEEEDDLDLGENCIIVPQPMPGETEDPEQEPDDQAVKQPRRRKKRRR